eukprot:4982665-Lingulodinium_polyedra.AAC.1
MLSEFKKRHRIDYPVIPTRKGELRLKTYVLELPVHGCKVLFEIGDFLQFLGMQEKRCQEGRKYLHNRWQAWEKVRQDFTIAEGHLRKAKNMKCSDEEEFRFLPAATASAQMLAAIMVHMTTHATSREQQLAKVVLEAFTDFFMTKMLLLPITIAGNVMEFTVNEGMVDTSIVRRLGKGWLVNALVELKTAPPMYFGVFKTHVVALDA